ncbi:MAG: S8 family serine peptidase [Phycisphaerae bacterium]
MPAESPREGVIEADPQLMPAVLDDDAIPLPDPAQVEARDSGDVQIAGPSGNPFFLGFVGGRLYPRDGERIDPRLDALMSGAGTRDLERDTYVFVMFQKRINAERMAELGSLGARVLGFHPHYCLKAALPLKAVAAVAALPYVRWVGFATPQQKIEPLLAARLASAGPDELIDAYISVFESDLCARSKVAPDTAPEAADAGQAARSAPAAAVGGDWMSNGWQQAELEKVGVQVVSYADRIRCFRVRLSAPAVTASAALDFVQYIELYRIPQMHHDESAPMVHADSTRASYDGGTNSVIVSGQMDTGLDHAHSGLNHIFAVGWDESGSGTGAFHDGEGHGSHVAGTILGDGAGTASYRGMAPGLGWGGTGRVYIVKIFDDLGAYGGASLSTLVGHMHTPVTISGSTTPIPHVINNSWGTSGSWTGTDSDSRTVDADVWDFNQFYVFSAGNDGPTGGTIGTPGVAKNVFTVGSVVDFNDALSGGDPGIVANTSSRGPTADNRWKPNICAPGRWIRSVAANTGNGFINKSGTSMAAPHVTGIAAEVMDHISIFRYAPQRLASLLMATAITKDNATLTTPSTSSTNHLNVYGTGRIEAYRAHWGTSQFSWTNWAFTQTSSGFVSGDFTVNTGATRLVVCMFYIEDAASSGASQALVNDIDLWIDHEPIDPAGNTGEYFAQQSPRDNTEIRIIDSPPTGQWRWKAWPTSVTGSARVSVTVSVIYGDTTPDGSQTLTAPDTTIQPLEDVQVTSTVTNPSYIASAVYLDSTLPAGTTLVASTTTLKDGAVTDLLINPQGGDDLLLGDIIHGDQRSATWTLHWATEGTKTISVAARSDNWVDETSSINIIVDGTAPALPTNLGSSTHTVNVWSANPNITFTWTAATDSLSGVDGYGVFESTAPGLPSTVKDIEEVTSYSATYASSASGRYLNLRTVDNSGNWNASYANTGPYLIDTVAPTSPAVRINAGAARTPSLLVALDSLSAVDAHSGVFRMQFSNNGLVWSALEPFAATRSGWNLSTFGGNASAGTKTVYARFTDRAGNVSAAATDTIIYAPGDINGDGRVDSSDLGTLLGSYGLCTGMPGFAPAADFDGNGCVDSSDLGVLLGAWTG